MSRARSPAASVSTLSDATRAWRRAVDADWRKNRHIEKVAPDSSDALGNLVIDGCTARDALGVRCGAPVSAWSCAPVRCWGHLEPWERREARRHGGRPTDRVRDLPAAPPPENPNASGPAWPLGNDHTV